MNNSPTKPTILLQQAARNQHIAEVLAALRSSQALSRAELSRETGLAKSSMSSIIEEMLGLGFICESIPKADGVGKPSTKLTLNPHCRGAIGVEINPGYVSVILTNLVGEILWDNIHPIEPGSPKARYLSRAEEFISQAIREAQQLNLPVLGIGIGLPGRIDRATGSVVSSSSLNWQQVPIQKPWQEKFDLPVIVDTEANMGAFGEHLYGCAQDIDTFLYINQSFGLRRNLGLAMMLDGKLWHGVDGHAGRVGHMVIDPQGPLCDCGQHGCWRVMSSDETKIYNTIEALQTGRKSILEEYAPDRYAGLTADLIHQAAIHGDALALEVLRKGLVYSEIAINNLINIFDPGVVIQAFSYTDINKPEVNDIMDGLGILIDQMLQEIRRNTVAERRQTRFGANSTLLGAASMVLNRFMENPKEIPHFQ